MKKQQMLPRERVLTALRREEPDRVPYCEIGVDRALAHRFMGWGEIGTEARDLEKNELNVDEAKKIASFLEKDNITYVIRAPVYAEKLPGQHGRLFYGKGLIKSEKDLDRIVLPDPHDDSLYEEAEAFVRQKGEYAAFFVTRVGIFPTILSMGLETFSIALFENLSFIEAVLDRYSDWSLAVAERVCRLGFDVFVSTDDMAFKTNTFFSPKVFHDLVLPRYQKMAEKISLPWVIHSDGNILPFLDDLLSLGIAGLHPNEKGAMDIRTMKREYGDRICLLGNVDLNLLGDGPPDRVEQEVRGLIRDVAPGGGYIVTCGNSLAAYLIPENVVTMARSVQKYGAYPISIS